MSFGSIWSITHRPSGVACSPFGCWPRLVHRTRGSTYEDIALPLAHCLAQCAALVPIKRGQDGRVGRQIEVLDAKLQVVLGLTWRRDLGARPDTHLDRRLEHVLACLDDDRRVEL